MPRLIQPGTKAVLEVAEESADYWRSLGYRDEAKAPAKADAKKAPAKKSVSKK
jgi:hypothetical protein